MADERDEMGTTEETATEQAVAEIDWDGRADAFFPGVGDWVLRDYCGHLRAQGWTWQFIADHIPGVASAANVESAVLVGNVRELMASERPDCGEDWGTALEIDLDKVPAELTIADLRQTYRAAGLEMLALAVADE